MNYYYSLLKTKKKTNHPVKNDRPFINTPRKKQHKHNVSNANQSPVTKSLLTLEFDFKKSAKRNHNTKTHSKYL